jgi:hypothetical protein
MAETIVCVASGPSLTRDDVEYCLGRRAKVLVINDGWRIAPWADWLYACDGGWWVSTPIGLDLPNHVATKGMRERWTCDRTVPAEWGIRHIDSAPAPGLSRDPRLIHEGENGGYQAINLAYHFGARTIVLLGYDMSGTSHWFGAHPEGLNDATDFSERAHHFEQLAADLKGEGVTVVNASRQTALRCFERAAIEDVL